LKLHSEQFFLSPLIACIPNILLPSCSPIYRTHW
jgi:hypothetical protein